MSKSYREQHPLLCDDHSDEEVQTTSPKFQRRVRYSCSSGRARAQIKGAAAILNRWPEHLSSILTYWWIGLGMIAVLIFIIYNSIVAIALLPPTHLRPVNPQSYDDNLITGSPENVILPSIFMHIFVTRNDILNINDHLSYIEPFSKKYSAFEKNFIFIINDSTDDILGVSDEMKNEMALNSLWSKHDRVLKERFQTNITFKIISLTKFMDESPIRKIWRRLPRQLMEFLTRCIAIWEKGGIAFNPTVLTPDSPSPVYIEKINTFLNQYDKINKTTTSHHNKNARRKNKRRLNNIRDIIDNLESENKNSNQIQYNLSEAEDVRVISTVNYKTDDKKETKLEMLKNQSDKKNTPQKQIDSGIVQNNKQSELISKNQKNMNENNNITSKQKLLPMFLKSLYPDPFKTSDHNDSRSDIQQNILIKNSNGPSTKLKRTRHHNRSSKTIAMKKSKKNDQEHSKVVDNSRLTIDLKGNLVATNTSCHAFIGSVFSNAIHHSENESITDFIIKELSIFCKGILSSCNGVDVILL